VNLLEAGPRVTTIGSASELRQSTGEPKLIGGTLTPVQDRGNKEQSSAPYAGDCAGHDGLAATLVSRSKSSPVPHFRAERKLMTSGLWPVAGVDEAGRGPLAGPVAAAAVVLDPRRLPKGLDDSKQLTAERRAELYDHIMDRALAVSVAFASAAEIDRINIRQATHAAMCRALAGLSLRPIHALVDGNDAPVKSCCAVETIIKGDASSMSIAAASIVAKVTRDRLMQRLALHHSVWGFEQHVGYGTRAHLAAIRAHGPSPFHRMTFAPLRLDVPSPES
jgi:ribonuclease HII